MRTYALFQPFVNNSELPFEDGPSFWEITVEEILDTGLPRAYDKPLYEQKCTALFERMFQSYPEREKEGTPWERDG